MVAPSNVKSVPRDFEPIKGCGFQRYSLPWEWLFWISDESSEWRHCSGSKLRHCSSHTQVSIPPPRLLQFWKGELWITLFYWVHITQRIYCVIVQPMMSVTFETWKEVYDTFCLHCSLVVKGNVYFFSAKPLAKVCVISGSNYSRPNLYI